MIYIFKKNNHECLVYKKELNVMLSLIKKGYRVIETTKY